MDIPQEWEDCFPGTIQELLNIQLSQYASSGHPGSPEAKNLFSQDKPHGYEGILAEQFVISPNILSVLLAGVSEASNQGFHSINITPTLPTLVLYPLWAPQYWRVWSIAMVSKQNWSKVITWLRDNGQDKAKV